MHRRQFIMAAAVSGLLPTLMYQRELADAASPAETAIRGFEDVVRLAANQAGSAFSAQKMTLAAPFAGLDQTHYNGITATPETPDMLGGNKGFQVSPLPPGMIYRDPVKLSIIGKAQTTPINFSSENLQFDPALFDYPNGRAPAEVFDGLNYSGLRLSHAINQPDKLDELMVFQGASKFRALAQGMHFGATARALALKTGTPGGEEFPVIKSIWIVEPDEFAQEITLCALLDSPSCTGAYEFRIMPGATTTMDIKARLFPRTEISQIGIAPLNSMFYFSPGDKVGIDDYRNAVHNSSGLQMITGSGRRLWRPLSNPSQVEISAFQDLNPTGFGLTQRPRTFDHYQDIQNRFEQRPSVWVEPASSWGQGAVMLVEVPTSNELNENIFAFWRPAQPIGPQSDGHEFAYRLHWGRGAPDDLPPARVLTTRIGDADHTGSTARRFVIDFHKYEGMPTQLSLQPTVSTGSVSELQLRELPDGKFIRASFRFEPEGTAKSEMQMELHGPDGPVSETWLYRWNGP